MSIEYSLKQKLNEIIKYAFSDYEDEKKERFTWFRLEVQLKNKLSSNGTYNTRTHKIVVNNINAEANNIKTLLHEVAHHIDWCIHGKTGHKKEFYDIYRKLLYSALDLNMVDLNQLKNVERRSTDYSKVQKILDEYTPKKTKPKEITEELYIIQVLNAYSWKEQLKERGYRWNKVSKTWDKENCNLKSVKDEKNFLSELCISNENINIKSNERINFSL